MISPVSEIQILVFFTFLRSTSASDEDGVDVDADVDGTVLPLGSWIPTLMARLWDLASSCKPRTKGLVSTGRARKMVSAGEEAM